MANKKIIYCPECGAKIMAYDGKGTTPIETLCRTCKKIVAYFPSEDKTTSENTTKRNCSSGMRFY